MCVASYNGVFHQIVTAEMSADSVVKTWSAETGDEICSFANAHGQSPVTAISFDYPGRRLLTGGHDGAMIKMWNFSNGALVKQFLKQQDRKPTNGASGSTVSAMTASSSGMASALSSSVVSALDDLSFLGIDTSSSTTSSSSGAASAGSGAKTGSKDRSSEPSSAAASALSPRRRKVRDIRLLPPTFGIDWEGRRNAAGLAQYTELPSPTRKVLPPEGRRRRRRARPRVPRETFRRRSTAVMVPSDAAKAGGDGSCGPSTAALSTYREKEVTSILDIERNLRVGMGDYICQRFVCSVGWDRSIFIWADKNDESEALPIHVLPNPKTLASNPTKCHASDILALVYIRRRTSRPRGSTARSCCGPSTRATSRQGLPKPVGSIDTMFYASKIEMLFASGEAGQLVCIDRSMTPQAVIRLEHPNDEAVTAVRGDKTNTHLVTGDAAGHLKLWDLAIAADHDGLVLDLCCQWRPAPAHAASARILGVRLCRARARDRAVPAGVMRQRRRHDVDARRRARRHLWAPPVVATGAPRDVPVVDVQLRLGSRRRAQQLADLEYEAVCALLHSRSAERRGQRVRRASRFLLEDSMPNAGRGLGLCLGHRARVGNANSKKQDNAAAADVHSVAASASGTETAVPGIFRRSSHQNARCTRC
ncbi:hypothetical protein PINS_up023512 [Pythium insidiosum]|nr:hypothetical protein PINS_up023512 [Pythium insidiosum]